jgi:hypothetical protein
MPSVAETVMAQYPSLAWLLNDPEVGPLLTQAVDPNIGFSAQTFQAKLMETTWWKTRSAAGRQFEVQSNTDPASAIQSVDAYTANLQALSNNLGVGLTNDEKLMLAHWGLLTGNAPDSAIMRQKLIDLSESDNPAIIGGTGQMGVLAQDIGSLFRGQWFYDSTMQGYLDLTKAVAAGYDSLESINARLKVQATQRFPHLADRINAGETLAQIAAPFQQLVANELELPGPGAVSMAAGSEWQELWNYRDPDTGELRAMTESEALAKIRDRAAWWQTSKGQQLDSTATTNMLNIFGARKA